RRSAGRRWLRTSQLAGPLTPGPLLDDPLVVLRELIDARNAADLTLRTGERGDALGPLDRLLLRGHVDHVEAAEQLLRLAVRTVGDHRRLTAEVHHHALGRVIQPFDGDEHARLDQLLVEPARYLEHLL